MAHQHKFHFLTLKSEFEQTCYEEIPEVLYRKVDYGYYVCNDCPDAGYNPNTIKIEITKKESLND